MSNATRNTDKILVKCAETFRLRNEQYKQNSTVAASVMASLFPGGIALESVEDWEKFVLLVMKVIKLTRFTESGMTHVDSMHDDAVYSAMIESILTEHKS